MQQIDSLNLQLRFKITNKYACPHFLDYILVHFFIPLTEVVLYINLGTINKLCRILYSILIHYS